MIIDLILDRKDGEQYNARKAYDYIREEEASFNLIAMGIDITGAMDHGTEEDVKQQLCKYVTAGDYSADICEYINSVSWLESDAITIDTVKRLAADFLNKADKYEKQVTAYLNGDRSADAIVCYTFVALADQYLVDAVNELNGENDYSYGLNYELAESFAA